MKRSTTIVLILGWVALTAAIGTALGYGIFWFDGIVAATVSD